MVVLQLIIEHFYQLDFRTIIDIYYKFCLQIWLTKRESDVSCMTSNLHLLGRIVYILTILLLIMKNMYWLPVGLSI